ncbi:DUF2949 domain-containing protein [Gloeobacter morelensis]|uniref:DUF2949 domain-containing protein n=1 Tax=Gloeobacter morelensis MG652769 TaxID=2781736 RepID=A0ABY3PHV7_9CYAN|nr:DUF2949 domain-containing protein [Gloeobacter morelensis]UFP93132.1 DUF2949 domain-containing protein [Gloeobacter morelensis MG652769]
MLQELLSKEQYATVLKAAGRAQDEQQLPLVAWALGFVDLGQLAQLLDRPGHRRTLESSPT